MNKSYQVPALLLPVDASIRVPGSKSHANRSIVCAVLSDQRIELKGATPCDDVEVMVENLQKMGFRIDWIDRECGDLLIHGGLPEDQGQAVLDCHNAGTTMRFLTSVASLVPGTWTLTGDRHMQKRPIKDLVASLRALGANIEDTSGCPPLRIKGGMINKNSVSMHAGISSQYLSSLLMIAPHISGGLEVTLDGELASKGYVELTTKVMEDFGVKVGSNKNTFFVQEGTYRTKNVYNVEGDWSAAGPWLTLEAIGGGTVNIENLNQASSQSDRALPLTIAKMKSSGGSLTVDVSEIPDQLMNLAVLAAFRKGKTRFIGARNLRVKECDRLHVVTTQMKKAGVRISEFDDGVIVEGGKKLPATPVTLDPHDDHRMVMCFAILGLIRGGITIKNPDCVKKSYPTFFRDLEAIMATHKPITVVGMRGAGKSSFGRRLASKLHTTHLDSDHLFIDRHGPIKEFVAKQGWEAFRAKEEEVIRDALRPGIVLSLGGGSLGSARTRTLIKEKSVAVWLQAKEAELIKRLQNGKRPPLTDLPLHEEVRKFLMERGPHYREVSSIVISPTLPFGAHVPRCKKDLRKLFLSTIG